MPSDLVHDETITRPQTTIKIFHGREFVYEGIPYSVRISAARMKTINHHHFRLHEGATIPPGKALAGNFAWWQCLMSLMTDPLISLKIRQEFTRICKETLLTDGNFFLFSIDPLRSYVGWSQIVSRSFIKEEKLEIFPYSPNKFTKAFTVFSNTLMAPKTRWISVICATSLTQNACHINILRVHPGDWVELGTEAEPMEYSDIVYLPGVIPGEEDEI